MSFTSNYATFELHQVIAPQSKMEFERGAIHNTAHNNEPYDCVCVFKKQQNKPIILKY